MRCSCCNKILSDTEATQKHAVTGEFLDTCNVCLNGLGIPIEGIDEEEEHICYDELFDDDVFYDSLLDEEE